MYNNELYHYGVKGMKWGVRHDYRLKGSNRSGDKLAKRKQKAQKYYDRANEKQKKIDTLYKERDSSSFIKKAKINKDIKRLERKKDRDIKDARAKEQGKLTRKQKAIAVGATVVAAYATYKFIDSGHATQMIAKGKAALGHTDLDFKKNANLSRKDMDSDDIMSSVVSRINPDYGSVGSKNNCRRCTYAYEMSRRGYDVKATKTIGGTGQAIVGSNDATSIKYKGLTGYYKRFFNDNDFYNSVKTTGGLGGNPIANKYKSNESIAGESFSKSIFESLSSNPDGARGELSVKWTVGGAHSMAWEIVQGKPVIFDCQTGEKFDSIDSFADRGSIIANAAYMRLDNIELDKNFLARWVKNA